MTKYLVRYNETTGEPIEESWSIYIGSEPQGTPIEQAGLMTYVVTEPDPMATRRIQGEITQYVSGSPQIIPSMVTMKQARQFLAENLELENIRSILYGVGPDGIQDKRVREEAQAYWETSDAVLRDSPFISFVKIKKGWTDEEVDNMFIAASLIDPLGKLPGIVISQ